MRERFPLGVGARAGVGDVVVEQSSLHRQIERGADDHVNLEHGLGRQPITVAAAGRGQLLVQVVEVVGAKPSQRNVPNGRCDVVLDEPGVAVGRGRSNLASLVRQPRRAQEVIEPDRSASCRRGAGTIEVEPCCERLGFASVGSNRVPAAPLPAGERVEAVVGHDVEPVVSLDDVAHPRRLDDVGTNPKIDTIHALRRSVRLPPGVR